MEDKTVLRQDILDKIKADPIVYGEVCSVLGVAPASLPRLLYNNDQRLTQAGVLKVLRDRFHLQDNDLLTGLQVA